MTQEGDVRPEVLHTNGRGMFGLWRGGGRRPLVAAGRRVRTVDSVRPPTDTVRPSRVWYWYCCSRRSWVMWGKACDGAFQLRVSASAL